MTENTDQPTAEDVHDRGFEPAKRAQSLIEALPYIEQFRGAVVVVKFGGNAMVDPDLSRTFACLLYTSPSPRDQRGSRMPSSA